VKMKISRLNFTEFTFLKHGDNKHRTLWTDKVTIGIAYEYNGENKAIEFFIKQGFLFDGASRPRLVNWIIQRWYKQPIKNIPALVHDAIFVFGSDNSDKQPMDFEEANRLF